MTDVVKQNDEYFKVIVHSTKKGRLSIEQYNLLIGRCLLNIDKLNMNDFDENIHLVI